MKKKRTKQFYTVWYTWRAPCSYALVTKYEGATVDSATSARQLRKNWKRLHPHARITKLKRA